MTNEQAQSLINYINLLTNRGIPPTPPMVKRFVKDITGIDVGKNYINNHNHSVRAIILVMCIHGLIIG